MNELTQKLKDSREMLKLSLSEVSKDLNIAKEKIEAIENNEIFKYDDIYEFKNDLITYVKYLSQPINNIDNIFNTFMYDFTSKIENIKTEVEDYTRQIHTPYLTPAIPKIIIFEKIALIASLIVLIVSAIILILLNFE